MVFCPFLSIFPIIRQFYEKAWACEYIKWPHDSTWVLFELVLCCLVADIVFVVFVIIIIALHTKNHLWWSYVIGSITLHFFSFSLFLCVRLKVCAFSLCTGLRSFYCHFIAAILFSLLTFLIIFVCHGNEFHLFYIIHKCRDIKTE